MTLIGSSIAMAKASEVFPDSDSDAKVREIKQWLKTKGVRDFEPVSLFCDQLTKVRICESSDYPTRLPYCYLGHCR
jgi:hypothetical protein